MVSFVDIFKQIAEWGFEYIVNNYFNWEVIKKFFWGKRIAVIGPTACGKDSLIARLQGKPIPKQHLNTNAPENIEEYNLKYKIDKDNFIDLMAKKSINVGGEEPDREKYWYEACKDADIIFYMLDSSKFTSSKNNDAAIYRYKNDLRWINIFKHRFKNNVKIAIILNKIDLAIQNNEINLHYSKLDEIARNEINHYSDYVCGIFFLSLTDDNLFQKFFPDILSKVAK